jgi:hypothetical protein
MAPGKGLQPVTNHTTGADLHHGLKTLCRAISMSLFVPLLEFNQLQRIRNARKTEPGEPARVVELCHRAADALVHGKAPQSGASEKLFHDTQYLVLSTEITYNLLV